MAKFSSSSNRKQFLALNKSSFTSQLIKGKSRDLQKLLQDLDEIVTFEFKGGTPDYGGRSGRDHLDLVVVVLFVKVLLLFFLLFFPYI